MSLSIEDGREAIGRLPPVQLAFAYGSGVFAQDGYDYKATSADAANALPMVDLVLAVQDPVEWHRKNIEQNPSHYSFMRHLGAGSIAYLQENVGGRLWYNTSVPMGIARSPKRPMKYGVISCAQLTNDLTEWAHLYAAGRLHKPVLFLEKNTDDLTGPLLSNLHSAVRVSLLQLPAQFNREHLYETISRLSYSGDIRMRVGIGENPNKVSNIVKKNMEHFDALYLPIVANVFKHVLQFDANTGKFEQDLSDSARLEHWQKCPSNLKFGLSSIPTSAPTAAKVQAAAARIVGRTSLPQTAMGLLSAGPYTATVYALKKVVKSIKGRLK